MSARRGEGTVPQAGRAEKQRHGGQIREGCSSRRRLWLGLCSLCLLDQRAHLGNQQCSCSVLENPLRVRVLTPSTELWCFPCMVSLAQCIPEYLRPSICFYGWPKLFVRPFGRSLRHIHNPGLRNPIRLERRRLLRDPFLDWGVLCLSEMAYLS